MSAFNQISNFMSKSNSIFLSYFYNKFKVYAVPMHYVSMQKVASDTAKWCGTIGSDFDTVIALPRSGMIVGSTMACILGKPLSTPDDYINGKQWASSSFARHEHKTNFYNRVIIVDDSIVTGVQMQKAADLIKAACPDKEVLISALYIVEEAKVDRYFKVINKNHCWLCEYNLMHGKFFTVGYDFDGVLCEDWDGKQDYVKFLHTAKPYKIPVYKIDFVITARKEKYRKVTEDWLTAHNVKYERLLMLPNDCTDAVKHKAKLLLKTKPQVYIESSPYIAKKLNRLSGCPVICIENNCFYK